MRDRSLGAAITLTILGAIVLTVPASTQGQRRGRLEVETVNGRDVVAREAIVRLRDQPFPAVIAQLQAEADAEEVQPVGRSGAIRIRSRSRGAIALVEQLSRRADVLYAEPNYIVSVLAPPNDPNFSLLWGLLNVGQPVNISGPGTPGADIGALAAWDISVGSTTNVVAVIDTGIDYTHPDLVPNLWSAPAAFTVNVGGQAVHCAAGTHGFNAIQRTCNPMDDHHHGTHTAGTIGASGHNGVGVVGVNWTTRLMGIKFMDATGDGTIADAIDAIGFAIQVSQIFGAAANVRVLSNSWGGTEFSQALRDEILSANDENMLFVAAAGNSAWNNDLLPMYPASYDTPNVVSVAATTNTDARAWFSNYGATSVHLGAPGMDILSTTLGHSYEFSSGTSMATPHVAGAAALILSQCALDTPSLKDALLATVKRIPALAGITTTGGRLNLHSALSSCTAPPGTPSSLAAKSGDEEVSLTWTQALGALRYDVKRSEVSGGPYSTIAADLMGTAFVDTNVVNDTTYYYVVSARNTLGESGNSNEASATPNPPADFSVSQLTAPAASGPGLTIDVTVTTDNQGPGNAGASTTRVFLSSNTVLDAADRPLEPEVNVPALAAGTAHTTTLPISVPGDVENGRYYLIARADANDQFEESAENNNTKWRVLFVGPDLDVTALTVPATGGAGQTISVTDTIANRGGSPAPPSVTKFYLSSNASLDSGDDVLEGVRSVPQLLAEESSSGTTNVTLPQDLLAGRYYVIAQADGQQAVDETSETNNTLARAIQIGGDLVVTVLTLPAAGAAGGSIVVTDTTANQGSSTVAATTTRFYLSENASFDAGDERLEGSRAVPQLGPGATNTGTATVTLPSDAPTGTVYIIARADDDDVVEESLESNNTRARSIKIGPDLTVTLSLPSPSTVAPGGTFSVTDTVRNDGAGVAPPTMTRFFLSTNGTLDAADIPLNGGRAVPALSAGQTSAGLTQLSVPHGTQARSYFVLAKADGDDAVAESAENNNTAARTLKVQ